jgi:hypothetical protein
LGRGVGPGTRGVQIDSAIITTTRADGAKGGRGDRGQDDRGKGDRGKGDRRNPGGFDGRG